MLVLLDNGHGGIINGEYQTEGKCSPVWSDGSQLFEGEFNRAIVNGIIQELTRHKIPYVNIAPEYWDVSLSARINRAHRYYDGKPGTFYLSIHSNAGGGYGSEIFTSPGQTLSDEIATIFGEEYKNVFPNRKLRVDYSDGDLDKEESFAVLSKTSMPAILTENFFMDNQEECQQILMTNSGRQMIIEYHLNAIFRVMNEIY